MNKYGKPLAATAAVSVMALSVGLAAPAGAVQASTSPTCRGVALSIADTTLGEANPAGTPCAAKTTSVVDHSVPLLLGSIDLKALQAISVLGTDPAKAGAGARISSVAVNLLGLDLIKASDLMSGSSTDLETCKSMSGSILGKLSVLGQQISLNTSKGLTVTLPLGLGAIYVNQMVTVGKTRTQRALFIDLPGTFLDVIVAQATTGCPDVTPALAQPADIQQQKPSKKLIRSVRARIEKLRDDPQASALTVKETGH